MQDFGAIKTVFNDILIEGIVRKDAKRKDQFKKYVKTIKESEILTTQFLLYNNIETKVEDNFNTAALYVSENLRLLEKYKIADIKKENKKLSDLLGPEESKLTPNKLYESLSYLILTPRKPSTVDKISTELKNVINYIRANKAPQVVEAYGLPNSFISKLMVDSYNEKYSDLSADEVTLFNILTASDVQAKKNVYNETVAECIVKVDNLLKEANDTEADRLNKVKAKLLAEQEINDEEFLEKVSKLIELKNNLS